MSGGNLSPRQKMIGMMYLVLTALLALNVSKDILDAFVLINTSLENTVVNYNEKNESLYSDFNVAKQFDPVKVTPFWKKAQKAKQSSFKLINYIKDLQIKLLKETEKITENEADTLQLKFVNAKDNYDIPTNIMIGQSEDGSNGLARELKDKLSTYKTMMLSLFNKKQQKLLNINLETDDVISSSGKENWEMGNFYHTPLAATITILSKIQTDIKKVEYDVVSALLQKAGKKQFNFDTIITRVIPSSNYVLLGEDYKADVFLAAFSTTQNPEILIGEYDSTKNELVSVIDSIPVNNGLGQYTVATTREGIFSYEGVLKLKKQGGGVEIFPFKSEYIVAKPSLVVSPDKMNVFYIGPKNPVSISVPGVASENIRATISGSGNRIKKTSNGKYEVKLSTGSPRNVNVNVSAIMSDGETRSMGKRVFVVKKLPKPEVSFLNKSGEFSIKRNKMATFPIVKVDYGPSFVFNGLPLTVTNCLVEVYRNGSRVFDESKMKDKFITEKTKRFFRTRLRVGDKVYFSKVAVRDVNGQIQGLSGMIITIK
ncbi:MAG: gliding motility protein GldM [Flavobacteriales bacterium]|nr:gliding motility protein GldM [Flavobacteriales bacterium]